MLFLSPIISIKIFTGNVILFAQLIPELPRMETSGYFIKGESIIYNSRENKISLVNNCYFENANYTAKASKITYWINENRLLMEDAVVKSKDAKVLIKAKKIEYFGRRNIIKANGNPVIYSPSYRVKLSGRHLFYDMNREEGKLWGGIRVLSEKDGSTLKGYTIEYSKTKETIKIEPWKGSSLYGIWKGDKIFAKHIKIEMGKGTVILEGNVRAVIHFERILPGKM